MVATNAIRNVDEPSPNIIDLIESGKIDYVVATSVKGRHPELGSVHIRRTAVERAIPCLTSMDTFPRCCAAWRAILRLKTAKWLISTPSDCSEIKQKPREELRKEVSPFGFYNPPE